MKDRLREVRKEAGLTQDKFADQIGLSKMAVTYYETGKRTPSNATIKLISEKFSVSETWLLTGEGEMHAPITREQEIANIVSAIYQNKDEFRTKLIEMLVMMNEEQMEFLKDFAIKLAEAAKNDK